MRIIKLFEDWEDLEYGNSWEKSVPKELTIIKDGRTQRYVFEQVLNNVDMNGITYKQLETTDMPENIQIDMYLHDHTMDVDITLEELMGVEFRIQDNKISIISNPLFKFDDNSIKEFINFINTQANYNFTVDNFKFLI